jgi:nicotinamidase-related amidase
MTGVGTVAGWDSFLSAQDKEVFAASGWGARQGLGQRPAVLVVDVSYGFCGDEPQPVLESITRWHNSCGEPAWHAIASIQRLLGAARDAGLPILYSTAPELRGDGRDRGRWTEKNPRHHEDDARANEIVAEIAPHPEDIVILKSKPSAFFASPLLSYLVDLGVDSLIVCGTTTSGCVRATVVDAFSYNYKVTVVQEATFDRGEASHWVNLFDMDSKYADVATLDEVLSALSALRAAGAGPGGAR